MLTEHQVEMIVPGLRILLPFMKVFLYFYISFFCCSAESFSLQGNSSNYSVSRPAEGSRLPKAPLHHYDRLVLYAFAVTIQALYYKPITQQTSAVHQQTAVSICHIQCLESDQTERKKKLAYALLLKEHMGSTIMQGNQILLPLVPLLHSLHYLYPEPGCVNTVMKPHERKHVIQTHSQAWFNDCWVWLRQVLIQ